MHFVNDNLKNFMRGNFCHETENTRLFPISTTPDEPLKKHCDVYCQRFRVYVPAVGYTRASAGLAASTYKKPSGIKSIHLMPPARARMLLSAYLNISVFVNASP